MPALGAPADSGAASADSGAASAADPGAASAAGILVEYDWLAADLGGIFSYAGDAADSGAATAADPGAASAADPGVASAAGAPEADIICSTAVHPLLHPVPATPCYASD